jgi:hypothetical protein
MACNVPSTNGQAVKTLDAAAGDSIKVQWDQSGHPGPITHYVLPVKDAATATGAGAGWVKIDEVDYVGGKWASEIMGAANMTHEFKLPAGLASGEYLVRIPSHIHSKDTVLLTRHSSAPKCSPCTPPRRSAARNSTSGACSSRSPVPDQAHAARRSPSPARTRRAMRTSSFPSTTMGSMRRHTRPPVVPWDRVVVRLVLSPRRRPRVLRRVPARARVWLRRLPLRPRLWLRLHLLLHLHPRLSSLLLLSPRPLLSLRLLPLRLLLLRLLRLPVLVAICPRSSPSRPSLRGSKARPAMPAGLAVTRVLSKRIVDAEVLGRLDLA